MPNYLEVIKQKRADAEKKRELLQGQRNVKSVSAEIARQSARSRISTQPVKVENPLDVSTLETSLADLKELTVNANNLLLQNNESSSSDFSNTISELQKVVEVISSLVLPSNKEVTHEIRSLIDAVNKLEVRPNITVKAPEVNVAPAEVKVNVPDIKIPAIKVPEVKIKESTLDVEPVVKAVESLLPHLKQLNQPKDNQSELLSAVQDTTNAINGLRFPIPNYVLPFKKDSKGTQVDLNTDGSIPVTNAQSKPTDAYALSNIDDTTSTEYYGYEDKDGNWYIKKLASNAITFTKGPSGYATAWTNRASQSYASYGSTF